MRTVLGLFIVAGLLGCATSQRGSTATMTIATTPPGAACQAMRDGAALGAIASTPGDITFDRAHGTIVIACSKEGYLPVTETEKPLEGQEEAIVPPILALASLVDSATGANYRYRRDIHIRLLEPGEDPVSASRPTSLNGLRLR